MMMLMGIMTGVNLMSARSYGEFEFWFASIKVAAIVVFIALAAAYACGFTSPSGPTWYTWPPSGPRASRPRAPRGCWPTRAS